MARTAAAKWSRRLSFEKLSESARKWVKDHPDETRVAAAGAAIAFFFTHGLPLWNEDYSQWLSQADGNIFGILLRAILPITSDPQGWGYSDRPLQVLLYKMLHLVFGYWGTGYFFVKSLVFGGLCGAIFHWMRELNVSRRIAFMTVSLFALSTNVISSLIWHSDFGVYSQLVLVSLLFWALPRIEKGPASMSVYKKGWEGMPKAFRAFLITFFAAVYLGSKLKGDVRLAPLVLLAYLYAYRRDKFRVYAAPFGITFLATLPWSAEMFKRLPPFLGGAGYQGPTFAAISPARIFEFLAGDLFARAPSASVLGASGVILVSALALYGAYRIYEEKVESPDHRWGFFLIWLGCALAACSILAPASYPFTLHYAVMMLVPATFLTAFAIEAAQRELGRREWFETALVAVIALQGAAHLYQDYGHRRDLGRTMVAVDKAYRDLEALHPNSQVALAPGFLPYGFRNSAAPGLNERKALANPDEISKFPAGATYMISWGSTLDARFALDKMETGCTTSLFDVLSPCSPYEGAAVLRYIGSVPEISQADSQDKHGDLNAALHTLDAYLEKEPSNHGVAFLASIYAYRLGNHERMEQLYDTFGGYFPDNMAVLYNWGLAKQGLNKFAQASKLLGAAYALAPKNYGIGFNLAASLHAQGKKSRALATLGELLQAYPNDASMKSVYSTWSKE